MQNSNMWIIGNLDKIGTYMGAISTSGMLFGANENGKWNYFDGKMCKKLDTNRSIVNILYPENISKLTILN